jgi:hypothetical protein
MLVNDRGERRRMVKDRFFLLWPTGCSWTPPVRLVTALGQTSESLAVFRPVLGSTDDFDKFNRETISVEPT